MPKEFIMPKKRTKLDDNTIRKLCGLMPATTTFSIKFTPKCFNEVEEEYRPVFILEPWTKGEIRAIASVVNDNSKYEEYFNEQLRKKIVGWDNLIDLSTCDEIDYKSDPEGGVSKELYKLLPDQVLVELINELSSISGIKVS